MERYPEYTRQRLGLLAQQMRGTIYPDKRAVETLLVSPRVDRISYAQAQELKYKPARVGQQFGPLWATFWFRASATVPPEWKGRRVDLLWISHSEATLWRDGKIVQGLNHEPPGGWSECSRPDAVLTRSARANESIDFQIEMACNKFFGTVGDHAAPFTTISPYVLEQCEIALFDERAWELYYDFSVLAALETEQLKDLDKTWGGLLLSELNRFANAYGIDDRATWEPAHAILKALYRNRNATITHELSAIGHAHIDTAWLWPLAETHRKCLRSFSTAVAYMDEYPEYKFACSQAYQYAAVQRDNPDLYERIKKKVKAGQFVPVGGTWVEPDCNIPSGEALARQFLYGQRFFQEEFGIACREFWNPDVFGYNGQLPQLCRLSGITRFLTQKLSWNRFNKPHHHTFTWEGIDGSEVFTHFPPADTYNAIVTVGQLRENARNYKDHDRSRQSLMLFGFGDGGGGPTRQMIEHLRRARDLQGLPRTSIRSSDEFFQRLEKDCADRVRLIGELYFEYHRGTYTTQAVTKRFNRKNEFLLHEVEFLSSLARGDKLKYPSEELDELWKLLLLNQFHDILPGSSITLVYEDAARQHADIEKRGTALRDSAIKALTGAAGGARGASTPINTIGFDRAEVAETRDGTLAYVEAPSYGIGRIAEPADRVNVSKNGKGFVLENEHLRATVDAGGNVTSLVEKSTGREALASPGNQLLLYVDRPVEHDAWDVDPFHMEQERPCPPAESAKVIEQNPLRVSIRFERAIGKKSRMTQVVRLSANSRHLRFDNEVDWREDHALLKVAFPANVRADNATYEMQFGSVERPTHFNTPYDLARYEVPGHKWSDLSEYGFGVTLLSESKYGFSTYGNVMRMSLLRSPKSPDPVADMGKHRFSYAIMPHANGWREAGVVAEAYKFNVPVLFGGDRSAAPRSFASIDTPNLVIDTIKKAEESDATIVRLYECHGARGTARLTIDLPLKTATFCNLLEEDQPGRPAVRGGAIEVPYAPYKIISIKVS